MSQSGSMKCRGKSVEEILKERENRTREGGRGGGERRRGRGNERNEGKREAGKEKKKEEKEAQ